MSQLRHPRDLRLDLFRGLALVMIFINHMPGHVLSNVTLARWGFSDAAEVFVLIAGMAAYNAYGRIAARDGFLRSAAAVFDRVRRLYVVHLVLFLLVTALCALAAQRFGDPTYLEQMSLDRFVSEPTEAVVAALTLTYLPTYLDILPLYIVLLALVPPLLLLFKVHALAPLGVSAALYVTALQGELNLPNSPEASTWYFNPFAWQLLFVTGATVAHLVAAGRWRIPFPSLVTAAAVLYLAAAFIVAAPWQAVPALANATLIPAVSLPALDKTNLSLVRYANVLAQAWVAVILVGSASPLLATRPARLLIALGRHSLDVFALGTVLSVAGLILMKETDYALGVQIGIAGAGIGAMALLAWWNDWRDAGSKPRAAVRPELLTPGAKGAS